MAKKGRTPAYAPKPGEPVPNLLPDRPTIESVRAVAAGCKACDLYKRGTQTVFGEGPKRAEIMLVGEQPGDAEDFSGHPFVGPAGKLLDHALISACRPWLDTEIALVKPRVLVCLGATAAQALLGKTFKVSKQRGDFVESSLAPLVTATVHPSSILRAPDDQARRDEMRRFVADLKKVAAALASARE